jgi:hypothetical protein
MLRFGRRQLRKVRSNFLFFLTQLSDPHKSPIGGNCHIVALPGGCVSGLAHFLRRQPLSFLNTASQTQ